MLHRQHICAGKKTAKPSQKKLLYVPQAVQVRRGSTHDSEVTATSATTRSVDNMLLEVLGTNSDAQDSQAQVQHLQPTVAQSLAAFLHAVHLTRLHASTFSLKYRPSGSATPS